MRLGNVISERAKNAADKPTVISLGQIWMDIMLDVDDMPKTGDFAVTRHTKPTPGGSYRILHCGQRRAGNYRRHACGVLDRIPSFQSCAGGYRRAAPVRRGTARKPAIQAD